MVREYRMMTDEGEARSCYRAINVKSVKSNCSGLKSTKRSISLARQAH